MARAAHCRNMLPLSFRYTAVCMLQPATIARRAAHAQATTRMFDETAAGCAYPEDEVVDDDDVFDAAEHFGASFVSLPRTNTTFDFTS